MSISMMLFWFLVCSRAFSAFFLFYFWIKPAGIASLWRGQHRHGTGAFTPAMACQPMGIMTSGVGPMRFVLNHLHKGMNSIEQTGKSKMQTQRGSITVFTKERTTGEKPTPHEKRETQPNESGKQEPGSVTVT